MSNIINGHTVTQQIPLTAADSVPPSDAQINWAESQEKVLPPPFLPPMVRNYRMTANLPLTNQMVVFSKNRDNVGFWDDVLSSPTSASGENTIRLLKTQMLPAALHHQEWFQDTFHGGGHFHQLFFRSVVIL